MSITIAVAIGTAILAMATLGSGRDLDFGSRAVSYAPSARRPRR